MARLMGWALKCNQSFRRIRIGFCLEKVTGGLSFLEVRRDIERLSLALGLAVSCP